MKKHALILIFTTAALTAACAPEDKPKACTEKQIKDINALVTKDKQVQDTLNSAKSSYETKRKALLELTKECFEFRKKHGSENCHAEVNDKESEVQLNQLKCENIQAEADLY